MLYVYKSADRESEGKAMTIKEAYEKHKHLDVLLSDRDWLSQTEVGIECQGEALADMWQAIKQEVERERN
ncbi:MAG: hypothetical protein V1835_05885 [Candidatus Micrarchaeota archaeon]